MQNSAAVGNKQITIQSTWGWDKAKPSKTFLFTAFVSSPFVSRRHVWGSLHPSAAPAAGRVRFLPLSTALPQLLLLFVRLAEGPGQPQLRGRKQRRWRLVGEKRGGGGELAGLQRDRGQGRTRGAAGEVQGWRRRPGPAGEREGGREGGRQGCAAWGISGTPRPRLPPSHPGRDERGRWTRAGGTGTMTFAGFVVALVIGTIPGARGLGQVPASLSAARHPQLPAPAPPPTPAGCPAGDLPVARRPWPPAAATLPRRGTSGRAPRGRRSSCALGSGRGRAERGRPDCERGERGRGAGCCRGCVAASRVLGAFAGQESSVSPSRFPVAGGNGGPETFCQSDSKVFLRGEFKLLHQQMHWKNEGPAWFYSDAVLIVGKSR